MGKLETASTCHTSPSLPESASGWAVRRSGVPPLTEPEDGRLLQDLRGPGSGQGARKAVRVGGPDAAPAKQAQVFLIRSMK